MPPRVGVDLVPLSRVDALLTPDFRPVLERMLRPDELSAATRAGALDASAVAGRLAAKEAVFKLFRAADSVLPWRSIHVAGGPGTAPAVRLEGRAAELARSAGIDSAITLSISHDGDYAIAVAATTDCSHCSTPEPDHSGFSPPRKESGMSNPTTTSIVEVKNWILAKHPDRQDVGGQEDLIETRLVDSLSFVEFIFTIEQASGAEIDMDDLDLDDLRTLGAIEKRFFTG